MTCNEINCNSIACALCFDCQQFLCLHHVIVHHDTLVERHLSFYERLQDLYEKLHSMNIEQCFHRVREQLVCPSAARLSHLRSIREELVEQLNRFKYEQLNDLRAISRRLSHATPSIDDSEAASINRRLDEIHASIHSLVYGIHMEISNSTVQCRKIFHRKNQHVPRSVLPRSSSWTHGSTENFWKERDDLDERSSLF